MSTEMMSGMEIINPPSRKINFNGEIVEISFIPMRVSLDAMRISEAMESGGITAREGFEQMIDITVKICSKSNPTITRDWLLDNSDGAMLISFLDAAVTGGKKESDVKVSKSGKN